MIKIGGLVSIGFYDEYKLNRTSLWLVINGNKNIYVLGMHKHYLHDFMRKKSKTSSSVTSFLSFIWK